MFRDFFVAYYERDEQVLQRLSSIPWHAWFYDRDSKGAPVDVLGHCDGQLVEQVRSLALRLRTYAEKVAAAKTPEEKAKVPKTFTGASDVAGWSANALTMLLDEITSIQDAYVLDQIDDAFRFSPQRNSEIRFRWLKLSLQAHRPACLEDVERMLLEQGRMKFTRPLYRLLAAWNKDLALKIFEKGKYHPICAKMVRKDLGI
jgi:hypothetical protein